MAQVVFPDDVRVNGTFSAKTVNLPDSSVTNAKVIAAAGIEASKLQHQHALRYAQPEGVAVAAETEEIHIFRAAGEIVAVEVVPITVPSGGDLAYSVDVQKGNASTPFATVLTAPVTVNSSSVTRTVQEGTVSTTTTADGDILRVVVTTSGSTGAQGQGFLLVVTVREAP